MAETLQFPQYRRYPGGTTFFKITGPRDFVQLDIIGDRYDLHVVEAKQFPEIQRIRDMLEGNSDLWLPVSEAEFEEKLTYCREHLKAIH